MGDRLDSEGSEWSYTGWEASMGTAYDFDYDIGLTWLYRYVRRQYRNPSAVSTPAFTRERLDNRHIFTVELSKGITEHLSASLGGGFTWNFSNVRPYKYDRLIGGAYLNYAF